MNTTDNIIDVNEADFEYQVIAYSQETPVVVDFWAEWCGPCRMLGPMLERLAREYKGAFRLAKIDVDNNPALARRFNVRSIPSVKAFRDGHVVAEFMGAQPEPRVREFLREIAPSEDNLALEKAQSFLKEEQWAGAENAFRDILDKTPDNPAALLGLLKSLLIQGRAADGEEIIRRFPTSRELAAVETIRPLVEATKWMKAGPGYSDDPLEAAYLQSIRLLTRGNLPAAMDGLLDILREDRHYRSDEARKVVLALFEILGEENPLTAQYRTELSAVLF